MVSLWVKVSSFKHHFKEYFGIWTGVSHQIEFLCLKPRFDFWVFHSHWKPVSSQCDLVSKLRINRRYLFIAIFIWIVDFLYLRFYLFSLENKQPQIIYLCIIDTPIPFEDIWELNSPIAIAIDSSNCTAKPLLSSGVAYDWCNFELVQRRFIYVKHFW